MLKRLFDIGISSLGLVVLAPVLLIVAVLVRWKLGTPVFFRQTRPGKGGKIFRILKFRTMLDALDSSGNQFPDGARITPLGTWLRRWSLDELPELWNVLRGDMSLVGPRPLLPEYLPLFSADQLRRHEVRPGITGWAQVNGRNRLSWEARFDMDVWYVDHKSFWLDIKIILMTLKKVLAPDGIAHKGEATMTRFEGNNGCKHLEVMRICKNASKIFERVRS